MSELSTGLNIAALSRRTGVPPDTLRKWEQRYRVLHPSRTAGGQRRYAEADVRRVEWLRARLREGYRIGEAASLLGAEPAPVERTPAAHSAAILAAAARSDAPGLGVLLDQAFALHDLGALLNEIVEPVLVGIGEAWERGEFGVAQEHLASEAIRTRLAHLLASVRGGVRGVAVLACAPGELHDIGLLMTAVSLQADGWQVVYLGHDTPIDEALRMADALRADVLGVSVALSARAAAIEERVKPRTAILALGGAGASAAAADRLGAVHVGGSLAESVDTLRTLGR